MLLWVELKDAAVDMVTDVLNKAGHAFFKRELMGSKRGRGDRFEVKIKMGIELADNGI